MLVRISRWVGALLVLFFLIQVVSGCLIAFRYIPSVPIVSASLIDLQRNMLHGDSLMRAHRLGSQVIVSIAFIGLIVAMIKALRGYESYRRHLVIVAIIGAVLAACWTGDVLVQDVEGAQSVLVGLGILRSLPWFGDVLANIMFGDVESGQVILSRLYAVHTSAMPLILFPLLLALSAHLWRDNAQLAKTRREDALLNTSLISGLAFLLFLAIVFVTRRDVTQQTSPVAVEVLSLRPEWYFMWYHALLNLFQGSWVVIGLFILPGGAVTYLLMTPYIVDRYGHRPGTRNLLGLLSICLCVSLVCLTIIGYYF